LSVQFRYRSVTLVTASTRMGLISSEARLAPEARAALF